MILRDQRIFQRELMILETVTTIQQRDQFMNTMAALREILITVKNNGLLRSADITPRNMRMILTLMEGVIRLLEKWLSLTKTPLSNKQEKAKLIEK